MFTPKFSPDQPVCQCCGLKKEPREIVCQKCFDMARPSIDIFISSCGGQSVSQDVWRQQVLNCVVGAMVGMDPAFHPFFYKGTKFCQCCGLAKQPDMVVCERCKTLASQQLWRRVNTIDAEHAGLPKSAQSRNQRVLNAFIDERRELAKMVCSSCWLDAYAAGAQWQARDPQANLMACIQVRQAREAGSLAVVEREWGESAVARAPEFRLHPYRQPIVVACDDMTEPP